MQLHAHKQAPQSSLTIITKVCTFLSTWSWHWQYETIIHLYIRKGDRTKFLTFEIILQKVKIRQGNGETEWIWTFPFFWWGLWKLCAGLIEDIRLLWSTPHVRNTKLLGFKDEIVNVVLIQEGNHSQKLKSENYESSSPGYYEKGLCYLLHVWYLKPEGFSSSYFTRYVMT